MTRSQLTGLKLVNGVGFCLYIIAPARDVTLHLSRWRPFFSSWTIEGVVLELVIVYPFLSTCTHEPELPKKGVLALAKGVTSREGTM